MSDDESKLKVAGRAPAGKWIELECDIIFTEIQVQLIKSVFIANFLLIYVVVLVKAGGMRIVQHKTPNSDRAAKAEPVEVIGMSQNNPIDQVQLSTSPSEKSVAHIESAQAGHINKPPTNVPQNHAKPINHIQQPRKQ